MEGVEGNLRLYEPELLRYKHIPKATKSTMAASEDDPLNKYILNTPDAHKARFLRRRQKVWFFLNFTSYVRKKQIFTVNGGDAIVNYDPAPNGGDVRNPLNRLLDQISIAMMDSLKIFDAPEQRKRKAELKSKHETVIKEVLGDAVKDMVALGSLATAPSKQRLGYGTMLVRVVTALADSQGRHTVLTSSNIANTGFYEGCGFHTVGEVLMGEGNPTWDGPPVILRVMVRPPAQPQFGQVDEKM
ncbi:hypothetical protein OBBRIDRAFT_469984 [Obba rivulosa]|uniref:N-acetyltransferase domain-containing protein n=1 Tax=Obba rivulosa TaxID=1052685 RepID=A0A8E2AZV8_9APHY|nr:hypothetical protein OBBRIDRAFT_469984 [Obba rivulosa]